MSKFECVSKYIVENESNDNSNVSVRTKVTLPIRATKHSAGYDFFAAKSIVIPSYRSIMEELDGYVADKIPYSIGDFKRVTKATGLKPTLIPTGVKCQLADNEYLEISVRSSTPLNDWIILANGVGIIDADYYNNPDNEGEIFFQVINLSPVDLVVEAGDKIGQGIIKTYGITEDDNAEGERSGGFGSTSEN